MRSLPRNPLTPKPNHSTDPLKEPYRSRDQGSLKGATLQPRKSVSETTSQSSGCPDSPEDDPRYQFRVYWVLGFGLWGLGFWGFGVWGVGYPRTGLWGLVLCFFQLRTELSRPLYFRPWIQHYTALPGDLELCMKARPRLFSSSMLQSWTLWARPQTSWMLGSCYKNLW